MKRYSALFYVIIFASALFPQRTFTLDDLFSNKIYSSTSLPGFKWLPKGDSYSFLKMNTTKSAQEIFQYSISSGAEKLIASAENLTVNGHEKSIMIANYKWSADGRYILITGSLPARRMKSGGAFFIYDVNASKIIRAVESEEEQSNIELSPDGNNVCFVRGNNLFVYCIDSEKTVQLTRDGSDLIINGAFDWVYEEEFSIIRGYEWAPDSRSIAFWRLDQSPVPTMSIQKFDSLHLNSFTMHYPKAGDPNSLVQIGVVSIDDQEIKWMELGEEKDIYIPRIKFTNSAGTLSIQRLDRLQHKLDLLFADVNTGKSKTVLTEYDSCWIDIYDDLAFLDDGRFLWTSERDGYKHLYLYKNDGSLVRQLTNGNFEIDDILGVDEKQNMVYFNSYERSVLNTDVYQVSLSGGATKLLTPKSGTHSLSFSTDFQYYTDRYSNVNAPSELSLYKIDGSFIKKLTEVTGVISDKWDLGKTEFFTFNTSDGVILNGMMILPPQFDPSKKYPVFFYNYSGPGSQTVKNVWGGFMYLYHQMLAQKDYIICMIDNRGTGCRGKAFKHLLYKRLGTYEISDHVEAVNYLSMKSFVDKDRIGIWGWSYGGYTSALAIMKEPDVFKASVAVAPLADWHYYDNIYTERYMSLPDLNPEGYENSSVLKYIPQFKGKFLLIHGTADDNVHFQNSVKIVEKMISENKQFQTMYYPEKDHGIYGGKTRQHLFQMMTDFILNNL